MIEAKNISKSFGEKCVLKNADFCIEENSITGFFGASGIGKSTLAKILCGVLKADTGEAYIDGKCLFSETQKYNRSLGMGIQMVYQQPYSSLDPRQKLIKGFKELISYHRFAKSGEEEAELIASLMKSVGLDVGILNHLPHQISGGESQRISIARSLLFKPRLLILDEATSMLDVSTQANIFALVKRIMKETAGAIMLISHDEALVEKLSNHIYLYDNFSLKEKN